jgi:hypothetical protein
MARHRLTAIVATTAMAVGFSLLLAVAPASAANPQGACNSYSHWRNIAGRYDAWVPTRSYGDYNPVCSLGPGFTGAGVRVLQQVLNRCYGAHLTTDGIWGPRTSSAMLRAFEEEGMDTDNGPRYNDGVRRRMEWVYWRYDDRGAHAVCIDNDNMG